MTCRLARQAIFADLVAKIYDSIPRGGSWITAAEIAAQVGTSAPTVGRLCSRQLRHRVIVVREPGKPVEVRRHPDLCRGIP